jgi:hypothetical protein
MVGDFGVELEVQPMLAEGVSEAPMHGALRVTKHSTHVKHHSLHPPRHRLCKPEGHGTWLANERTT